MTGRDPRAEKERDYRRFPYVKPGPPDHIPSPIWTKATKHLPSVIRCSLCGYRVLGTGTVSDPWRCPQFVR
jgi:hypothetical protein